MNQLPARLLIRVIPRAEKGGDIFGYPDEKADQKVGEGKRHEEAFVGDAEKYPRVPKHKKDCSHQNPAHIDQKVVGKKIEVDRAAERHGKHRLGPARQADVEPPPSLA